MLRLNINNQNLCLKDALTYWFPLVLDDDFDARMPHTKQEGGECGGGEMEGVNSVVSMVQHYKGVCLTLARKMEGGEYTFI